MSILQFLIIFLGLILLIVIVFFLLIHKRQNKVSFLWIFLIGAAGWLIAFYLRIIPLQLIPPTVFAYLWGAILAGLFEEITRYLIISQYKDVQKDRLRGPFILGLGWTAGEIFYLYANIIPYLTNESEPWSIIIASFVERFTVSGFHILVSFIVFYSIYEKWPKKISLYLAIFLHFAIDALIFIWVAFLSPYIIANPENPSLEDYLTYIWTLEGAFFLFVIFLIAFVGIYWVPKQNKKYPHNNYVVDRDNTIKE